MAISEPALIAETPRWLVFDKPPGWLTIPGRTAPGETPAPVLSNWAKAKYGDAMTVHRLDRETSGLVLFARTPEAHRQANLWFQNHEVKKIYHCLAVGAPAMPVMRIKKDIEGSPSATQIEAKERYAEAFLAHARPLTGRRHQIRIHLASEGHALWGDPLYHGPRVVRFAGGGELEVPRVALHAAELELPASEGMAKERYTAPWPEDFKSWVERLRGEGKRA